MKHMQACHFLTIGSWPTCRPRHLVSDSIRFETNGTARCGVILFVVLYTMFCIEIIILTRIVNIFIICR